MTKQKKKLLWILIPAAVAAAVIAAAVLLHLEGPKAYLEQTSGETGTERVLLVHNPDSEDPVPLPRYPITPPEGYEQVVNSAAIANRYSESYWDQFYRDGLLVELRQYCPEDGEEISLSSFTDLQSVEYQGRQVFCCTDGEYFQAIWMEQDHLIRLSGSGAMEQEELLAWVAGVDSKNPQLPQTRPLFFIPPRRVQTGYSSAGYPLWEVSDWTIGGNPQPPRQQEQCVFPQPPQGFTQVEDLEKRGYYSNAPFHWNYLDQQNNPLVLENCPLSFYEPSLFDYMSYSMDQEDWDPVEQVTVKGREGLLYCPPDVNSCTLVWLEDNYYVRLIYLGRTDREQMMAWAEQTVTRP